VPKPITYKDAGVDIDAGAEAVKRMKKHIKTRHVMFPRPPMVGNDIVPSVNY